MKKSIRCIFALLMAVVLAFSLTAPALAAQENGSGGGSSWFLVYFPFSDLAISVGEEIRVTATVEGADAGAVYEWYSSVSGVVSIRGDAAGAYVSGLAAGSTEITLSVTNGDGTSERHSFELTVKPPVTKVSVSGGGSYTLKTGETASLNAAVSGGSGEYTYEWTTTGENTVSIFDNVRGSASVYAGRAGTGVVSLTVYDAEDHSNNATVQWNFTVEAVQQAEPPAVALSRSGMELGAGNSATLTLSVSGGSGSYEYYWQSDNSGVVAITPNGASAELKATSTLLPGANTAEISAVVFDKVTGLISNTAACSVTVTGQSASRNYSAETSVGSSLSLSAAANDIDSAALSAFGKKLSGSASIKLESTSSTVGTLRFSNGTVVSAGTNYSFDNFRTMLFRGEAVGTFSTNYWIVDGANSVSGRLSISVNGGVGVTGASLSAYSLRMPTYSTQNLRLTVSPAGADYSVSWTSQNASVVGVSGSGSLATLRTGSYTGRAVIIATVTDSYGSTTQARCEVTVYDDSSSYDPNVNYNTTLSVSLGSDYSGSNIAESITEKYKSVFGSYPSESGSIRFTKLGDSLNGTLYLRGGSAAQTSRYYTLRELAEMYFSSVAVGVYTMNYEFSYGSNSMSGEITIRILSSGVSVSLTPVTLQMSPYSSQYVYLNVEPTSRSYRVSWTSSDSRVASVSGNNASAVVNSYSGGTAVITAIVTDSQGVETRRSCTVVVSSSGSTFNPSVSTTLGIPYTGTGVSDAMRSQFKSVYGVTLPDSAVIRFSSTGNTEVAVMRRADGSMIRANVDYTLSQFVAMYTQPVAAGTYSVPYTLSYSGRTLSGTISVIVNPSSISTDIKLTSSEPYLFSSILNGTTGGVIFADSIRNSSGSGWAYLRFSSVSNACGTLYLNSNRTQITQNTNITPQNLSSLYFVPGAQNGTFNAPYTIYTSNGTVVGTGVLNISLPGPSFTDVNPDVYYAQAVDWAVGSGVTSGTGGGKFSPDSTVTRGQAVTFLWRASGQPKVSGTTNPFKDVKSGSYYYDAVLWAVQQGITQGTSSTTFTPDGQLNRDQLLTFLCRSNGGYAGGSDWSRLAVDWARNAGLLDGIPGVFVANSACPRSDVVYYIWKANKG